MSEILFKIKSKHSPPSMIEIVRECRDGTPDMFNEAFRIARNGVVGETTYGWEYLPASQVDIVEIHLPPEPE